MITSQERGFKRNYAYGGAGIFDTLFNFLTRIFSSEVGKQITSSAVDIGKSVAKEGAKKVLDVGKAAVTDAGTKLVKRVLTPKSQKILEKHIPVKPPATQNINTLIDGSGVNIQKLVKKLNNKKGKGIKVI